MIARFEKFFRLLLYQVSYRSPRKIKDYIVRSKPYTTERKVGSSRCCNPKGQVCASIQVTDTFSSLITKSTYKINRNFNCNSKCLIYLLSFKTCSKQCTGKKVDKFRSRWINSKAYARKAASVNIESFREQFFQNHYLQDIHHGFSEDVKLY